jgi:hypothetical protein
LLNDFELDPFSIVTFFEQNVSDRINPIYILERIKMTILLQRVVAAMSVERVNTYISDSD